jgi:hypothetical protein
MTSHCLSAPKDNLSTTIAWQSKIWTSSSIRSKQNAMDAQAGWFAGSILNKMNEKDLEEALKEHPLLVFKNITNLELCTKVTTRV